MKLFCIDITNKQLKEYLDERPFQFRLCCFKGNKYFIKNNIIKLATHYNYNVITNDFKLMGIMPFNQTTKTYDIFIYKDDQWHWIYDLYPNYKKNNLKKGNKKNET